MKFGMIVGAMMAMLMTTACGKTPCDLLEEDCIKCSNTKQREACVDFVKNTRTAGSVPGFAQFANDSCQNIITAKTYDPEGAACKAPN